MGAPGSAIERSLKSLYDARTASAEAVTGCGMSLAASIHCQRICHAKTRASDADCHCCGLAAGMVITFLTLMPNGLESALAAYFAERFKGDIDAVHASLAMGRRSL